MPAPDVAFFRQHYPQAIGIKLPFVYAVFFIVENII
jgi:hypothetical protein